MDTSETGVTQRDSWSIAADVLVVGLFGTAVVATIVGLAVIVLPLETATTVGPVSVEPFALAFASLMTARVTNLLRPAPNRLALPLTGEKDGS